MALISLVVAIYYNVIMAYTLYYFFSSMQAVLPWTECKSVSVPFYLLYAKFSGLVFKNVVIRRSPFKQGAGLHAHLLWKST